METLSCRKVDVCCIQETIYSGGNCRTIKGKDTRYYWLGNDYWPPCGYHSVCECPTEWSSDGVKDLFFDQLGTVTARISEFLIHVEIGMAM